MTPLCPDAVKAARRAAVGVLVVAVVTALAGGCKSNSGPKVAPDGGAGRDGATVDARDAATCNLDAGVGLANGLACGCSAQCKTGNCVDGVCCDTPCTGTCMKCSLSTSLGTCSPTPPGEQPRVAGQCMPEPASTCGHDGTCDGAGHCRNYPLGIVCQTGICDTDAITGTYRCDGTGTGGCKPAAAILCPPLTCDRTTEKCFTGCTSDSDCAAGHKCVNGSCGLLANGAACTVGSQCASSFCADGYCCNNACSKCQSCAIPGLEGSCSPLAAGQSDPRCGQQDPSTCGFTGICDGFSQCAMYPANSPCGASTCAGATSINTARTCDGLGTCLASEVRDCGSFRCANGACNTTCTAATAATDCAAGIACLANGSCGTRVDGQPCSVDGDCQNQHCVRDTTNAPGICCNTACAGACRSCATGRCTATPAGNADPRGTCVDLTGAMCATDGKCDGAMACRRYPLGTQCAPETCAAGLYTGPSTCNASGQCIRPGGSSCSPYKCNTTKCFSSCDSTNVECAPPNVCGMNGLLSQCGLKPIPSACSADNECQSGHCAQGVCCATACNTACHACNLSGTLGTCSNVASGADPQGMCASTAATSCGTTGQCAAGQCARWAAGTQCAGASCPTTSTRLAPSTCNGTGTCVSPSVSNCAPGRCTGGACVNTCTVATDCTPPAVCGTNMTCGLQPAGGSCTSTSQCAAGLTCYLTEGSPGVCCNTACSGTCESCRLTGNVGTCTAVAAGAQDPDPTTACVAVTNPTTCGLNGRCAGNNNASNGAGTARCQFFGGTQSCRSQSCAPGNATTAAMLTSAATCNGAGACPPAVVTSCGFYNKCVTVNPPAAPQCATSCASNADCAGATCNTQNNLCGSTLANGMICMANTDCTSGFCADGVCCNSACTGTCMACNLTSTRGTCTIVPLGTADAMCAVVSGMPCGHTGLCAGSGACANTSAGTSCGAAASCSGGTLTAAHVCDGSGACPTPTTTTCPNNLGCNPAGTACLTSCAMDADCTGSNKCNNATHQCTGRPNGQACTAGTDCASANCIDGFCCNTACSGPCMACNLPSTMGTCTSVPIDTADALCGAVSGMPCGHTGLCASGGACANTPPLVPCAPAVCSNGTLTPARTCNGTGVCSLASMPSACPGGLGCMDGSSCKAMCSDPTTDCADAAAACDPDGGLSCI